MMKEVWYSTYFAIFYSLAYLILSNIVINISGAKYELPKYVLSEPTNLIQDSWRADLLM
jgi:uncharacterized phage infection (PIP) family protein YhgE